MRYHMKKLLALGLSLAMAGAMCAPAAESNGILYAQAAGNEAEPSPDADLEADLATFDNVSSADLADVLSPGWNLGNTMEANAQKKTDGVMATYPDETAWSNPKVTKEIFEAVKAAGFKSVRIPVSYLAYVGDADSGYKINEAWMDRVEEVVRMALSTGLYVNTNVHGDGYYTVGSSWLLCGEPADKQTEIKAKYKAVWQQIAERFKDCDEHLIFESMNEEFDGKNGSPNANTKEAYQNIVDYNQIFVDTVRESGGNNAKRWLMVCGWNTNIDATCDASLGFQMPTDELRDSSIPENEWRIMVSCHYYSPWQFCGQEDGKYTQWGQYAKDSSKVWPGANEEYMASQFEKLQTTFTSQGIPVYIGEYGAIDKTQDDPASDAYRSYFMKKLCEYCKKTGCVPVYWDQGYNGNYAFYLFDRRTFEVTKPALVNAIMDVYDGDDSPKTAENITNVYLTQDNITLYKDDDATVTLKAVFDPVEVEDTVVWASSDEKVAAVDENGVVSCVDSGTCTVTATSSNGTVGSAKVTVGLHATGIQLSAESLRLDMDTHEAVQMEASLLPEGALDTVSWQSSDRSIARVNSTGKITAVGVGTCTITATLDNAKDVTATCQVTVYSASAPEVTPTPSPLPSESAAPTPSAPATPTPPAPAPTASTPADAQPSPAATEASDSVSKGKIYTVKKGRYQVTNVAGKTVAFKGMKQKSSKSFNIPGSVSINGKTYRVTSIAASAFKNSKKLAKVTVGPSVTTIGKQAFAGCKKLKHITVKAKALKKVGAKALDHVNPQCRITFPGGKAAAYRKLFRGKGLKL